MKRFALYLLAVVPMWLVVLLLPVKASPRHWYTSKAWWAGETIIALSVALDAHSTCQGFGQGLREGSVLLYGNRSCPAAAGISLGAFAGYTALHAAEWHVGHDDPNKVIRRLTPWMLPAAVAPLHFYAAGHNYLLEERK